MVWDVGTVLFRLRGQTRLICCQAVLVDAAVCNFTSSLLVNPTLQGSKAYGAFVGVCWARVSCTLNCRCCGRVLLDWEHSRTGGHNYM